MSDERLLLVEHSRGVVTLALNRPDAFNSLSLAVLTRLEEELDGIANDPKARVVVLTGKGKAFCAGHDLKEMGADLAFEPVRTLFTHCSRLMMKLARLPQPVIARVDGIATAAGCQLVAACDLAICSRESRFATSGVKYGLFCSTPMVALSRNLSRKHAMEMLLTGEAVDAPTAREFGLVNRVVPPEYLDQIVTKYAETLASKSPLTLKTGKEAFYAQAEMDLSSAYEYASQVMVENMMARDAEEGIGAFIDKRRPEWTGE